MPRKAKPTAQAAAPVGTAEGGDELCSTLNSLALQIGSAAIKTGGDGVPLLPIKQQIDALRAAGSWWALSKKHGAATEAEGAAWGQLAGALMNGRHYGKEEEESDDA